MQQDPIYILLADDDEDDRDLFVDAFSEIKLKTEINVFNDGEQLMAYLNMIENKLPQVLFLDLNMPKKNGMECLKEIKDNNRLNDIVICIYSTSASDDDIENTFVKGANVYIKKPSNFNHLKNILQHVVTINWQYHTSGLNKENFLLSL